MPRLLPVLLLGLASASAMAGDFVPGQTAGALARGFALPALGNPLITPRGKTDTRLTFDVANEYVSEGQSSCAVECITLDGETQRLSLEYRHGLNGGWDFTLNIPYVKRGGGFMDGWIQDWHGWFGLPNGGRELAKDDQYRYRYERGGTVYLDETDGGGAGLGDVSVGFGHAFGSGNALRFLVKAPTGEQGPRSGGNTGGAVWLETALPFWDGYFAAGYSRNEAGDVLTSMQNREIWFGGFGVLMPVTQSVRLLAQVDAHTRLYDGSMLTPLARNGAPLTLGLQFRMGTGHRLDLGFQEDPIVNGSPDFVAYVSWR